MATITSSGRDESGDVDGGEGCCRGGRCAGAQFVPAPAQARQLRVAASTSRVARSDLGFLLKLDGGRIAAFAPVLAPGPGAFPRVSGCGR